MSKRPDLQPPGLAFYRRIRRQWALDEHHEQLLVEACRSLDRAEEARATITRDGTYLPDRHGQLKAHPAVLVERDHRTLFARLVRELGLSAEGAESRPPTLHGRYEDRA